MMPGNEGTSATGGPTADAFATSAEYVVGRDAELLVLGELLDRVAAGGTELVGVTGRAGYGKTALVSAFGDSIDRGIVGYGKYDPVRVVPYGGLGEALRDLVGHMLALPDPEFATWIHDLGEQLGSSGAPPLTTLIPSLEPHLGAGEPDELLDGEATVQRLYQAVQVLIDTIAMRSGPIVLVIDDLQWAGRGSLTLIQSLVSSGTPHLLIVGAWRIGEDALVEEFFGSESTPTVPKIEVGMLDRSAVAQWFDVAVGAAAAPDIVAIIDRHTHGNPLFLRELTRRILADGTLKQDRATGRWQWDRERLRDQPLAEGLAELLTESLDALPEGHAAILSAVACLGTSFDLDDAISASGASPDLVAAAIWSALQARLVVPEGVAQLDVVERGRRYRFAHDRIAEAARSRLTPRQQQEVRLRIGRGLRDGSTGRLFDTVIHLSAGADLVADADERADLATRALDAGHEARRQAAFTMALAFYEAGLSALDNGEAGDQTTLRRRLNFGAAEAAWLVGDGGLDAYLDQAVAGASTPADRARVIDLQMKVDLARHEPGRALDLGVSALTQLGISLPRHPNRVALLAALARTSRKLRGMSDEDLESLPVCTDAPTIAAQPVIAELISTSYAVEPDLFPYAVLKAVDLTIDRGRLPISPVAFAAYGLLLVVLGRYDAGLRFGDLALRMAEDEDSHDYRPWTHFLHYNFIHHWHRPTRDALGPVRAAQREALQRGDPEYAGYLAAVELAQMYAIGEPFADIEGRARTLLPTIRTQEKQVELCEAVRQSLINLLGRSDDPTRLAGDTSYDEDVIVPRAEEANDIVSLAVHANSVLELAFLSSDNERAVVAADRSARYLDGLTGTTLIPVFHLANAMSRSAARPDDRQTRRALRKALRLHEDWAARAPANHEAAMLLLRAENARLQGRVTEAERGYEEAIRSADQHQLPIIGALARESAAALYRDTGRSMAARPFVEAAVEQWEALGNEVRLARIKAENPWLEEATAAANHAAAVLDRAERAVATDSNLDQVVEELVGAAIEASAADRCVLFLMRDEGPVLVADSGTSGLLAQATPLSDQGPYAASLVRYALRSRDTVRVDDATVGAYARDPHIVAGGVRSLLAVPIVRGGELVGLLYAEHGDPKAFTAEQRATVEALCRQIALTLENAELRRQVEALQVDRFELAEAHARFVPVEFLHALGREDLRALQLGETLEREMTMLFSDIRRYTTISEHLPLDEVGDLISGYLQAIEPAIVANDGFLLDVRGDEILALFGASTDDAVRAALAMQRAQRRHSETRVAMGREPVAWGIAVNHGPVVLAMVGGVNRMKPTALGDSLNLASRVEALNRRYESGLLITEDALADLEAPTVYSIRRCERVKVVGRGAPVVVHEVFDEDPPELREAKLKAAGAYETAFAVYDAGRFEDAVAAFEDCLRLVPGDRVAELHRDHAAELARTGVPVDWDAATVIESK